MDLTLEGDLNWEEKLSLTDGFADRETAFAIKNPGERVFSVELLTSPLIIERRPDGELLLIIDRTGVKWAVYKNNGKKRLAGVLLGNKMQRESSLSAGQAIHSYILGRYAAQFLRVEISSCPYRWGSGGVLPVVKYRNRRWIAFFLRDIEPVGWNISLGSSDHTDDLDSPESFICREFLEEFLVLHCGTGGLNSPSSYYIPIILEEMGSSWLSVAVEDRQSKARAIREVRDNIPNSICAKELNSVKLVRKRVRSGIEVRNGDHLRRKTQNVLFTINPMENGIEAVAVVQLDLPDSAVLLDGELLPNGEAVRLPVALISEEYLERSFGRGEFEIEISMLGSIDSRNVFGDEDIHIFDWDLARRRQIAFDDKHISDEAEKRRFRGVAELESLKSIFGVCHEDIKPSDVPTLFTPAAAKAVCYYLRSNRLSTPR